MLIIKKLVDYQQLIKFNLSSLVVFSSVTGYIIVPDLNINFLNLFLLALGGFLVTAAANASNELYEIHTDKLMKRTMKRPLPDLRMRPFEAFIFIVISLLLGLFILQYFFNTLSATIALISYILYAFVYTPLKRISPISVFVGAIPGSLPCTIGWAAATNDISTISAWTLFIIQFFWQFPHFWAIAWVGNEDYTKAGMKMLPRTGKVGHFTAFQCVLYSSVLIPLSALPMFVGLGSYISLIGLLLSAIWLFYNSSLFLKDNSDQNAKKVMYASFVYLPVAFLFFIIDRFI
ncbi:MAG: Protoheme IX farnesyltransferase [Bacteroidetes bacterium OLB11]|nr:MAG: Protoheme IX farnesyltransferase [Bacteroidetes bacterium OLB11]